jgi:hypothetical protein
MKRVYLHGNHKDGLYNKCGLEFLEEIEIKSEDIAK